MGPRLTDRIKELQPPAIDYEAVLNSEERILLREYGWEISEDEREARLYSEEWSSVQAAVYSTKWWIEECK